MIFKYLDSLTLGLSIVLIKFWSRVFVVLVTVNKWTRIVSEDEKELEKLKKEEKKQMSVSYHLLTICFCS